jgi:acylphosphatase
MSESGEQRLTAVVRGVVQGVGFRAFVQREGRRLRLSGYARNQAFGSVEVVAEGPADRLRELETALRRGPSGSRVESVGARYSPAEGGLGGFEIR